MIDDAYTNAFKEVYEILKNTDDSLVNKIPKSFISFIESNMNKEYHVSIRKDVDIDKQSILPETEAILALIYRSYWIDKSDEVYKNKSVISKKYKNIEEIFSKRRNMHYITLNNELMIINKESFFKRLFSKIFKRILK